MTVNRESLLDRAQAIHDRAKSEGRPLSASDRQTIEALLDSVRMDDEIAELGASIEGPERRRLAEWWRVLRRDRVGRIRPEDTCRRHDPLLTGCWWNSETDSWEVVPLSGAPDWAQVASTCPDEGESVQYP
jgi:hypothetical protein